MELEKIRNLSDDELAHQEKTSAEQLFRLRFQVSLGQNDGVKKLRQLRREIAQIKTVARERELGINGEIVAKEAKVKEPKAAEVVEAAPVEVGKKPRRTKKAAAETEAAPKAAAKKTTSKAAKTEKATKGAGK